MNTWIYYLLKNTVKFTYPYQESQPQGPAVGKRTMWSALCSHLASYGALSHHSHHPVPLHHRTQKPCSTRALQSLSTHLQGSPLTCCSRSACNTKKVSSFQDSSRMCLHRGVQHPTHTWESTAPTPCDSQNPCHQRIIRAGGSPRSHCCQSLSL
jgi:hypothetical protein